MSRWAQYDEDEHRLPEGMTRVGYDADTQRYTFQDSDGSLWEGPSGARYGVMRPAGSWDETVTQEEYDATTEAIKQSNREAWRNFSPFLLLILIFLLGVFYLLNGSSTSMKSTSSFAEEAESIRLCNEHSTYEVQPGDTCWALAEDHGITVDDLKIKNGVNCDALKVGETLCFDEYN